MYLIGWRGVFDDFVVVVWNVCGSVWVFSDRFGDVVEFMGYVILFLMIVIDVEGVWVEVCEGIIVGWLFCVENCWVIYSGFVYSWYRGGFFI